MGPGGWTRALGTGCLQATAFLVAPRHWPAMPDLPPAHVSFPVITTPVGRMHAVACDGALVSLRFVDAPSDTLPGAAPEPLHPAARAVHAFFEDPGHPIPLPLHPHGTPFQQAVWSALQEIPPGQTRSYADIAHQIGRPRAIRAVAQAIARNPIHLLIPCHRVIGSDGHLTGFAAGLWRKKWLLEFERTRQHPVNR